MPRTPTKQPQEHRGYVEVRLSPAQAWAVQRVLDSVLDDPDQRDKLFGHHQSLKSAHRSRDAVSEAVTAWEARFLGNKVRK